MKPATHSRQSKEPLQPRSLASHRLSLSLAMAVALGLAWGCAAAHPNQPSIPKAQVATSGMLPPVIESQRESGPEQPTPPPKAVKPPIPKPKRGKHMTSAGTQVLTLQSAAFEANKAIPEKFTCDGANINPPLHIANVPAKAKTLALIVEDPDAPHGTFTHWLIWNIPAALTEINEAQPPITAVEGTNDFRQLGYGGPCPPSGTHHYRFKLYALDTELNLPQGASRKELERAMRPHVLAESVLTSTYHRQ